jgi:aspartate racemase
VKTIGLLGGMSWESTVPYYQTINRVVGERLGGLHSARIVLYSVDFHEIEQRQHTGRWEEAAEILVAAARALQRADAAFLVLCTNTMHMEDEFYRGRLESRHGPEVLVPPAEDRAIVHRIIYEELCLGRVLEDSRAQYRRVMDDLARRNAEGVILGCTSLGVA